MLPLADAAKGYEQPNHKGNEQEKNKKDDG